MPATKVLIVDDVATVRRLVAEALSGDSSITVVGEAAPGREALDPPSGLRRAGARRRGARPSRRPAARPLHPRSRDAGHDGPRNARRAAAPAAQAAGDRL